MGYYYIAAGNLYDVIRSFQTLLEKNSSSDKACQGLISAYQRAIDRGAAIRTFTDFSKRFLKKIWELSLKKPQRSYFNHCNSTFAERKLS